MANSFPSSILAGRHRAQKFLKQSSWEKEVRNWPWQTLLPDARKRPALTVEILKRQLSAPDSLKIKLYPFVSAPPALIVRAQSMARDKSYFLRVDNLVYQLSQSQFIIHLRSAEPVTLKFTNRSLGFWPTIFFIIEAGSKVTILEDRLAPSQVFGGGTTFVSAGPKSSVQYYVFGSGNFSSQSYYSAQLKTRAHFTWYNFEQVSQYRHSTFVIHHVGQGDEGKIVVGLRAVEVSKTALRMINSHIRRETTGNIAFRGIGSGQALAQIWGMIRINKAAAGTNSLLSQDALLFSEQAKLSSIPNLEILNNDVRASHSATVGTLNEAMLYYLASRGISRAQAERLLLNGFFEPLIRTISSPPLVVKSQQLVS